MEYKSETLRRVLPNAKLTIVVIFFIELIAIIILWSNRFSKRMLKYGKGQFFMGNESRTKTGHHGLGLYIANAIITKHNGELLLSNNKNGGGLVIIKLPICDYKSL